MLFLLGLLLGIHWLYFDQLRGNYGAQLCSFWRCLTSHLALSYLCLRSLGPVVRWDKQRTCLFLWFFTTTVKPGYWTDAPNSNQLAVCFTLLFKQRLHKLLLLVLEVRTLSVSLGFHAPIKTQLLLNIGGCLENLRTFVVCGPQHTVAVEQSHAGHRVLLLLL